MTNKTYPLHITPYSSTTIEERNHESYEAQWMSYSRRAHGHGAHERLNVLPLIPEQDTSPPHGIWPLVTRNTGVVRNYATLIDCTWHQALHLDRFPRNCLPAMPHSLNDDVHEALLQISMLTLQSSLSRCPESLLVLCV